MGSGQMDFVESLIRRVENTRAAIEKYGPRGLDGGRQTVRIYPEEFDALLDALEAARRPLRIEMAAEYGPYVRGAVAAS
jgi:DNA invertase Pin-like site-specific DNA recombinase